MTILYKRALLLAKVEDTFRTDAGPISDIATFTFSGIDSTADVDDTAETITITGHGMTIGSIPGPFQASIDSGALPTGLAISTDYWLSVVDANTVQIATSAANAYAGTFIDLTDAVGEFTLTPQDSHAVLIADPTYSTDVTILDRDNVSVHISPDPGVAGRKIGSITFNHEVRHNGNLDGTVEGRLGRLLRGCGMSGTAITTGGVLDDAPVPVNGPVTSWTFTDNDDYTGTLPRVLELTCTTGGAVGAAEVSVYSPAVGDQAEINLAGATFTTGFALTGAGEGPATIDPVQVGAAVLSIGDTWILNLTPPGFTYEPVSEDFDSITFHLYYNDDSGQSLRHIMTGSRGTFTVEGEAANFASFTFTFTGDFVSPTDVASLTSPTYENTIPPQVELANLSIAGGQDDVEFDMCAQSFSIDMGNDVVPRDCINEEQSLGGAIITDRNPTAGFNPETVLEATHPFWGNLGSAARVSFSVRVGSEQGNVVTFWAPYAQYSSLPYSDRNGIRAYDVTARLNTDLDVSGAGNDELRITFS